MGCVRARATVLLTVLHWDQATSMIGRGGRADWRLRRKRRPVSAAYRAGVLLAVVVLVVLPYGEELVRCARTGRVAA